VFAPTLSSCHGRPCLCLRRPRREILLAPTVVLGELKRILVACLTLRGVGGAHSELRLPKRRRGQRNCTSADINQAVRQLVLIASDDPIAGLFNRNGLKTGNGNRWTRERVTSMRSNYHIPVFKPADDGTEPWLNLGNAAKLLKIAPKTLRLAAEAGEIEAIHPLPDGPWIFACAALALSAAQSITERARLSRKDPAGSHPNQQNLFS
jgi:hypothetical protein